MSWVFLTETRACFKLKARAVPTSWTTARPRARLGACERRGAPQPPPRGGRLPGRAAGRRGPAGRSAWAVRAQRSTGRCTCAASAPSACSTARSSEAGCARASIGASRRAAGPLLPGGALRRRRRPGSDRERTRAGAARRPARAGRPPGRPARRRHRRRGRRGPGCVLHARRRGCSMPASPRAGRRGHGDLRPEHVASGPVPVVIDCLEFAGPSDPRSGRRAGVPRSGVRAARAPGVGAAFIEGTAAGGRRLRPCASITLRRSCARLCAPSSPSGGSREPNAGPRGWPRRAAPYVSARARPRHVA